MTISLIVAVARNGVIGAGGRLPWRLPEDLRRFKALTLGKPVIMGRKTWEAIGKPLPGRRNIVVSRDRSLQVLSGAIVVRSPEAALREAGDAPEVMIIGGAALYEHFLPRADRIYLTRVEAKPEGDVRFPPLDLAQWREVACEAHPADARHAQAYVFLTYERAFARATLTSEEIAGRIEMSGLTIFDDLTQHPNLYFSADGLQERLMAALVGLSLNYPLRTRSKVVKTAICKALGYPVPNRFKKVRPRFPGQNFDTYVQKANNLQIWNEELSQDRRYVIIRVDEALRISAVRVVTGEVIAAWVTTGTLTRKYQAAARKPVVASHLVSSVDTSQVADLLKKRPILPIEALYRKLITLVGRRFTDPGSDQERNRGAVLHQLVQQVLGHEARMDTGQFPDVLDQLLEIKLQTSPTIDLGLVRPDSTEPIELIPQARHCDVRYAVFYATSRKKTIRLDHVVVSTGERFFEFFRRFEGKEINRKRQIRLPQDFFHQAE